MGAVVEHQHEVALVLPAFVTVDHVALVLPAFATVDRDNPGSDEAGTRGATGKAGETAAEASDSPSRAAKGQWGGGRRSANLAARSRAVAGLREASTEPFGSYGI